MIEKSTVIFTSLGRTGTKFFAALFQEIIRDGTTLHEPDVFNLFQYRGADERLGQVLKQIREVGAYNLIIQKALGRWSLIELSDARLRGELSYPKAAQRVLSQRRKFVRSRNGSMYVEANIGYYGLIDVLRDVYRHCRIVYIVRDGRDWVRSHMNWGQMYGKGKIRTVFAHTWPSASEIPDDPYQSRWKSMSRFEKLCWAWTRLNEYALATIRENPNARLFRFESIFESKDRYRHLEDLVQFATVFPHARPIDIGSLEGWLERQVHKSEPKFAPWERWSTENKQQFTTICGPLMKKLEYEYE